MPAVPLSPDGGTWGMGSLVHPLKEASEYGPVILS